jgi:hypothetical protein
MAELLTKIPTNLTEYPNSFKRQGCFPLEAYSVFYATADKTAFEAAQDYATNNGIAYVGQTLAVVTTKADDISTVEDVTFYIIADAAGTLQEVGKATNGDGKSIVLTDGILSLAGFEAAQAATLPQKQADGSIKWVPIDSIVEGDTNTKTVIAKGDNETHVIIETVRDETTDTNTYKISLDLSAYATAATIGTTIENTKTELEGKITAEETARKAADEALETKIAEALQSAKDYADANDANTVYDDTQVKADIKAVADRVTPIETAIGNETSGLIKSVADNAQAIRDEASARSQGDADTLQAAKNYTDGEITGLDIVIEKKTIDEVESDYIVIKNKEGTEVASVNAAKFVKDGMLDSAVYSTDTKKLVLTWNTDAGKEATEIDLNGLIDTYTGSEHIVVGTDGVISIGEHVALDSDLTSLETAFNKAVEDEAKARDDADKALGERIDGVKATAEAAAVKTEVEAALALKADATALEGAVNTLNGEIAKKADAETTAAALEAKLNKSDWDNAKGTFAIAADVNGQFNAVGQRIDIIEEAIGTEADGDEAATGIYKKIEDLSTDVATNYATKTEVADVESKADSNTADITNLTTRLNGIVAQGGEPNTINTIKVNGVTQTIDSNKAVDITVPVISEVKVSALNDGQALIDKVTAAESTLKSLGTTVDGNSNGIVTLANRLTALETEVKIEGESRIDTLEATVNGVEGVSEGLVGKVAALGTKVGTLETKDTELAALIQANTDKFANYDTSTQVDSKISKAIGEIDYSSYVTDTEFESYRTTVTTELDKKADAAEVEASFETVTTEVANKADKDNVYDKSTADATFVKSADFENLVDARVNTLIGGANSTDTITNVTNLVEFVNNNADVVAQLVTDVKANGEALKSQAALITANGTAIKANTAAIEALGTTVTEGLADITVHESAEIGVAARTGEGQSGIELNV